MRLPLLLSAACVLTSAYGGAAPTSPTVTRPLHVFIFDGSAIAPTAKTHVEEAIAIWRSAGIVFSPIYKTITGAQIASLLGADKKLQSFFGDSDKDDEPGYSERANLQSLKPKKASLAVFFLDCDLTSRADPYRFQVYITKDGFEKPVGRTVAHEIGHLLLGPGHAGKPGVPWTSALMEGAGTMNDTSGISERDAATARERAKALPAE